MPAETESTHCCVLTYRNGTKIIAWFTLVLGIVSSVLSLQVLLYLISHDKSDTLLAAKIFMIIAIVVAIMKTCFSIPLLIGVYLVKSKYLILWMRGTVVFLVFEALCVAITAILASVTIEAAVSVVCDVVLNVYFIFIVYRYYKEIQPYVSIG